MRSLLTFFVALSFVACANTEEQPDLGGDLGALDGNSDAPIWPDTWQVEAFTPPDGFSFGKEVVYAHTADTLYKVDPTTLEISLVGAFIFPAGTEKPKMTDIALDKDGRMIGVTGDAVFEVDPETAGCTYLADAASHYVGLSFVTDPGALEKKEFLMGMAKGGEIYEIDPQTGQATLRGTLGNDPVDKGNKLKAAGDIVSVRGYKTLATVERPISGPEYENDWLAELDPATGKATLIGDTKVKGIWGLGLWKQDKENKVFGFTNKGEFVLIDVRTGEATIQNEDVEKKWWGAGVTTVAPVVL